MTRAHMSLVASPLSSPSSDWLRTAVPQHDGDVIAHVASCAEDLPRLASVIEAIGDRAAFDQVVLDVGAGPGTAGRLEELGAFVPITRLGVPEVPGAVQDALEVNRCAAVVLHVDDHAGLCCALAAARLGIAIVRVGGIPRSGSGRVIARLADVLLTRSPLDEVTRPATVAPDRAFVIGNPLVDMVQRHARGALAAAAWRRYDILPGAYNFAVLTGKASFAEIAPRLNDLAARSRLILEAPSGCDVAGAVTVSGPSFLERLSLERAAKAIFTDSERVAEEATVLGVPCHNLQSGPELPAAAPSWDGPAGVRAADAFVANFARVRLSG